MSNEVPCDNLFLDSYNLIHRSRFDWGGGLAVGENQIVYNFLKSIKPILEKFNPKKVYFILDGAPKARLEADSNYKANRTQDSSTPEEEAYWASFHKQKRTIINLAKELLPFTTVYHPDFECDDILAYLATTTDGDNVIISSDTDFIQALDISDKVKLWNPVSQQFRERLDVDYTKYKAMVGDKTDNIPGVKGIGKVGAIKILKDETLLAQKMATATFKEQFEHSYRLVKFENIGLIKDQLQFCQGFFSEEELEVLFENLDFKSMLQEPYFSKYVEVMEKLS
jgi:DNA polymerase I